MAESADFSTDLSRRMLLSLAAFYAWHWPPYAFVVLPSFVIQAAAYIYWRVVSRTRGFAVVAGIHALANLLPALYTIAYATRKA